MYDKILVVMATKFVAAGETMMKRFCLKTVR